MRNSNVILLFVSMLFFSCTGSDPVIPFKYETNPHYQTGFVEFYGSYYIQAGNKNNVLSLSLLSDSLRITGNNQLVGYGQRLFLEDVFVSPSDTLLPIGTYTIAASGEPFSLFKGEYSAGGAYTAGATISYYEKTPSKSIIKLISSGSFIVSLKDDTLYTINCDFKTADNKQLKGYFTGVLPHFDRSVVANQSIARNKLQVLSRN